MGFEHDQGTCTGRGFTDVDADGYLKNLHDFVTGHADWSIILDRSTYPTQETCTAAAAATDVITCAGHDLNTGEMVRLNDTGNGLPSGLAEDTDYFVQVIDANSFALHTNRQNLIADTRIAIGDFASNFGVIRTEPYILISPSGTPSNVNDLKPMMKWGYHTEEAGYVRCQFVASYDSSSEEIVFVYDGIKVTTLDAAAFVYDFRANDNGLFYAQTSIASTWRGAGQDDFTPLTNFLENPVTISGTTQNAITNGSDKVVQMTDAAEAALFTKNEWYYIYDFRYDASYPRLMVAYGECTGVGVADGLNADEIQFGTVNNDFKIGAIVSPYPLTTYTFDKGGTAGANGENDYRYPSYKGMLPFNSRADGTTGYYCIHDQAGNEYGGYAISRDYQAIITGAPDDKGIYVCQRPLICEYQRPNDGTVTGMNRVYGESKNIYLVDDDGLSVMTTGREIDSKEHISIGAEDTIFINGSSNLECLALNEA